MRGLVLLLGAAAIVVSVVPPVATASPGRSTPSSPAPQTQQDVPPPSKPRYPRLDSYLNRIVAAVERAAVAVAAEETFSHGPSVDVTIRLSDNVRAASDLVSLGGGRVAHRGVDFIEAAVPVGLLPVLAEWPGVLRVQTIVPPQPAVTSQGATLHRSPVWNGRGFTGAGVKVGVIDLGFIGASSLLGSELPASVVVRCYTAIGVFTPNLADCETDTVHGAGVAEAVLDIAPDVSLYIARPTSPGDLQEAALWMVSQGVQVINYSALWTWDGPGDGTSPFTDSPLYTVDLAVAGGAVWVNSAGNEALSTFSGGYSDSDGDAWLEFAPGTEANAVHLSAGQKLIAQARWEDDWGASARDLDLYLFDSGGAEVSKSDDVQAGGPGHYPYELLIYTAPASGTYSLKLLHHSGTAPAWVQLQAFSGPSLAIATPERSVGNPAESANPGMLAVGAANWATPDTIEPFSSLGPTRDGRTKPDIVGADRGDSLSYGPGGFAGTSQASPHVAGLAALVLHQFPSHTPAQVADYLKANAIPRGAVPNNTWGYGLARLPSLTPSPPTDVAASVAGPDEVLVGWSAPLSDGGSPITQYTVTSSPPGGSAVVDGAHRSATVAGFATPGTLYTFTVTAANAVGPSEPSVPSNAVMPLAAPTPTPTSTPTATPTPTPSPTPTPTRTPTPPPTPTPTPAVVPGVSGSGLGMLAGAFLVACIWAVWRLKQRRDVLGG